MKLSQVPGSPTFRSSALNAVAVIPLLSSDRHGNDDVTTHSSQSFQDLMTLLCRYNQNFTGVESSSPVKSQEGLVLLVPHSSLTQPGDFKYSSTPLRNFHWGHGCQRMQFFDGRPYNSRMAHDRLINHTLTRDWIDICPSRRTAALIGVLNIRDCPDEATFNRAIQEWQQWAERYSTPPFEVTAHGRDFERDHVVKRLFVFDSFHDANVVDMSAQTKALGSTLVAFPPSTESDSGQMMDLHINVVINDLAVGIFKDLERKIKESDAFMQGADGQPLSSSAAKSRFGLGLIKSGSSADEKEDVDSPKGSTDISINNLASVVSPNNKLAVKRDSAGKRPSSQSRVLNVVKGTSSEAQLLTPLDDFFDYSELSPKDAHEMMRREVARREKFAADLSLLAGSPLDAYERYTKAADLCKTTCPDPLWYASALEGCASAHIAMSDVGGFNVDDYLESSFQLPDEIMACAVVSATDKSSVKQNLPNVVFALCEDALDVFSRHPKLACFHAELLLKLGWYVAELEDVHERCQWGLGEGCYGGEAGDDKRRWEMASATQFNFLELKTKDGEDIIIKNTLQRCQKWTEYLHSAASTGALDPITRADVALRCASICLKGLRPTVKPTIQKRCDERIQFKRKAAFFAVAAAEAMSDVNPDTSDPRANALWTQASSMLSQTGNGLLTGKYGWATLRAGTLHALVLQGLRESSEEAAIRLLALMSEITSPNKPAVESKPWAPEAAPGAGEDSTRMDDSSRSDSFRENTYTIAEARSYMREKAKEAAKDVRAKSKELLSGKNTPSSLLAVAQSKWVEDDAVEPTLLPLAEFSSDFSNNILALRSVWSAIKFESCAMAQRRLLIQISDLRKKSPASSLPNLAPSSPYRDELPVRITSICIVGSDFGASFQRVKVKQKTQNSDSAMATFYNPFANKKTTIDPTIIPLGEERYVLATFSNNLSIPFEVASCKIEFDVHHKDRIKAPAISFVIPGQTKNFPVQFPFIILRNPNEDGEGNVLISIKGLQITTLSRSLFLPVGDSNNQTAKDADAVVIPPPSSEYTRKGYKARLKAKSRAPIRSPVLELVPPQPFLQISFVSAAVPIDDETVIPATIADGEIFSLPKLCLWNDRGQCDAGMIEELQITALGLPGKSELILFDLTGSKKTERSQSKKLDSPEALSIEAECVGIDPESLNKSQRNYSSYLSLKLFAGPSMGAVCSGCNVTLRIRYRGEPASPTLQVWRMREIQIRVLHIKGPRISSMSFRCDLMWKASYTDMCKTFSVQDAHRRYKPAMNEIDLPKAGSTDEEEFVANRLGQDPGVHVCGENVVVLLSVANESSSSIVLSKFDDANIGFEGNTMQSLKILPGVSAKFPVLLNRVKRAPEICDQVVAMTKLKWNADLADHSKESDGLSGGPMIPMNRRVREGTVEIPKQCLKNIIDENPVYLSRICEAPCTISVNVVGAGGAASIASVEKGKSVDVIVEVNVADWLSAGLLDRTSMALEFCCAKKYSTEFHSMQQDYIWIGQIRKALSLGNKSSAGPHLARLLFLQEGDYCVSASASFSQSDAETDVKEVWWSQKAATVTVTHPSQ
jgi:hypothetical protein